MRVLSIDVAAVWAAIWPAATVALLRIADVTLNVFRTVFVVQERRALAALAAGAEAGTWLCALGLVFSDITLIRAVGYVAGVAAGTAIGVELTRKLRLGMVTVRVYTDAARTDDEGMPLEHGEAVARAIHAAGYRATIFRGRGYRGPVDMILATVRRREADKVVAIARGVDPAAFAAIDNSPHPAPATTTTAARV